MSEARMDRDLDQTLTAWMADVAPDRAPSRLLEETFARTMKARQARTYPWHGVRFPAIGRLGAGSGVRTGILVLVALVLTALAIGFGAGSFRSLTSPTPSPSATLEPLSTPTVPLPSAIRISAEAAIPVVEPGWPVFDGTALWVFGADNQVTRIDPATNAAGLPRTIPDLGPNFGGVAANSDGLWVTDFAADLVYRIDPVSLEIVAEIEVGSHPGGVSAFDDAVWTANLRGGSVTRIDPATNEVVATVIVGDAGPGGPHAIDVGLGSVWVSAGSGPDGSGGTVVRIDPATNLIQATIPIPANASACGGFAVAADAVWMSSCFDQPTLVRIDPSTNLLVATIPVGGYVGGLILIDGAPWFTVESANEAAPSPLVRIDPATNTIDRVVSLGDTYRGEGLAIAAGSVWAQDMTNDQVLRIPLAAFGQ